MMDVVFGHHSNTGLTLTTLSYGSYHTTDSGICMLSLQRQFSAQSNADQLSAHNNADLMSFSFPIINSTRIQYKDVISPQ